MEQKRYIIPALKSGEKFDWDDSVIIKDKSDYLNDGRPIKYQVWAECECTFVTYFISKEDLEDYSTEQIIQYLKDQGVNIETKYERYTSILSFTDKNGNECWSINVTVGVADDDDE